MGTFPTGVVGGLGRVVAGGMRGRGPTHVVGVVAGMHVIIRVESHVVVGRVVVVVVVGVAGSHGRVVPEAVGKRVFNLCVILVAHAALLALVPRHLERAAHVVRDVTVETALLQQRVDGLNVVPTW